MVIREYERGWGSKDFVAKEHDTKELAIAAVHAVNAENDLPQVPDYYHLARYEETMPDSVFESINR